MKSEKQKARHKIYRAAWYLANRERILAAMAEAYRGPNKDAIKARAATYRIGKEDAILKRVMRWQEANKEKVRGYKSKSKKKNREKYRAAFNADRARYHATKLRAVPKWANKFFIEEIYDLANRRTKLLSGGHKWHVDHIVPLRSKLVCGLHVHNNLQVVPGKVNQTKNNRYWPGHPDDRFDIPQSLCFKAA